MLCMLNHSNHQLTIMIIKSILLDCSVYYNIVKVIIHVCYPFNLKRHCLVSYFEKDNLLL